MHEPNVQDRDSSAELSSSKVEILLNAIQLGLAIFQVSSSPIDWNEKHLRDGGSIEIIEQVQQPDNRHQRKV